MSADWNARWAPAMRKVAQAETENFVELMRIGGLDPAQHLRLADWSGVDFSGCDLRGADFTGARLLGCKFDGALIADARFDQAEIDRVGAETEAVWDDARKWHDSLEFGGVLAKRNPLRAAADWAAHVAGWRKPEAPLSDAHLPTGAVFQDAPFGPELVIVLPGEFMMGSLQGEPGHRHAEGPLHCVTIPQAFAVGRFTVTFEEWDFAQDDKEWRKITGLQPRKPKDQGWGRGNRPVIDVSWEDAQAYAKWLRATTNQPYRLLSEAEWEYVCRAGKATPFWWGTSITPDQANYDGNSTYEGGGKKGEYREKTLQVDQFKPNPFGLYQVHGNVWEWVEDCWNENYEGAPNDGSAWTTGDGSLRVLRGGSWFSNPQFLRSAFRRRYLPGNRGNAVGFRLSRTLSP